MSDVIARIAALCGLAPHAGLAAGPLQGGGAGLLLALFLAGAAGSLLHCLPMCGPFVLGQAAQRMACIPAGRLCGAARLRAGMLGPYHAGRLTTYMALGALAALPGIFLGRAHAAFSGVLLGLAALLFLGEAARRLMPGRAAALFPGWARALGRSASRVGRGGSGYAVGLVLGLLPCGFLYGAVAVAGAVGDPLRGAACMLAFGAGTIPALLVLAIAGELAARHFNLALARIAPAVLGANALLLAALAWRSFTA